jgi:hypothetical protein
MRTPTAHRATSKSPRTLTPDEHVDVWRRSGTSARAYAELHGLKPSSLYSWRRRSRAHNATPRLLPVVGPSCACEVALPDGRTRRRSTRCVPPRSSRASPPRRRRPCPRPTARSGGRRGRSSLAASWRAGRPRTRAVPPREGSGSGTAGGVRPATPWPRPDGSRAARRTPPRPRGLPPRRVPAGACGQILLPCREHRAGVQDLARQAVAHHP